MPVASVSARSQRDVDRNATCVGLLSESSQRNHNRQPDAVLRQGHRGGPAEPGLHTIRPRTIPLFRCGDGLSAGAIPARPALLIHVPRARRCSLPAHPSTELRRLREARACPVAKRRNAKSVIAGHSGKSPSPEPCAAHLFTELLQVTAGSLPKPRSEPLNPSMIWNVSTHVD